MRLQYKLGVNHHDHIENYSAMKILILSYYANLPGACQAEWLDDKVSSLLKDGNQIGLISSVSARSLHSEDWLSVRVPSLSLHDYLDEIRRLRSMGEKIPWWCLLLFPLALTLGAFVDLIQFIFTKGVGEGRWSWLITTLPATFVFARKFKPDIFLSTGGPASAHLVAIFSAKVFKKPLIVEFQDPLSGDGIGRNSQSRGWLSWVENFIVQSSNKVVYVTNHAARQAKEKYRARNVVCVYPGARNFDIGPHIDKENNKKFRAIHLGSLYSTRNFDTLIAAINNLIASKKIDQNQIEVINLGHVAEDIANKLADIPYIKILSPVSRIEALHFAAKCNLTLLIQNGDERSKVTIPYKTYDYLNLHVPLLALTNSEELSEMIKESGHCAISVFDVASISIYLSNFIGGKKGNQISVGKINSIKQANELIKLPDNISI